MDTTIKWLIWLYKNEWTQLTNRSDMCVCFFVWTVTFEWGPSAQLQQEKVLCVSSSDGFF